MFSQSIQFSQSYAEALPLLIQLSEAIRHCSDHQALIILSELEQSFPEEKLLGWLNEYADFAYLQNSGHRLTGNYLVAACHFNCLSTVNKLLNMGMSLDSKVYCPTSSEYHDMPILM